VSSVSWPAKRTVALFVRFSREIRSQCSVLGIDSWSVKHVSDAHEDQNELTDGNSRRRGDREEEQCLVGGRSEENERRADYCQDAGEPRSSQIQRNQPDKRNQQPHGYEEPSKRQGSYFMESSLDS